MIDSPQNSRDDGGAATILVIIAMTAILLGAGLAIDVGQYVVSARSAQNTADATVLAVAADCAIIGSPTADYSPYRKPGQTISAPACGDGQATITATKTVDGLLLKQTAGDVNRPATAKWGTLSGANTLPIVFSSCEFSETLLDGEIDITIYLDDTKPQTGCSSLPGGFSGLDGDGCSVPISAEGTAPGQPGVGVLGKVISNGCLTPIPLDVLFPMYDSVACQASDCKGNGQYPIAGFAAFRVSGYSFNGGNYDGTLDKKCPDLDRGKYCIRGDFIKFTTPEGTPGESEDFGLYQVFLSD